MEEGQARQVAEILIQSLKWLQEFDRQFVVIKLGGSWMQEAAVTRSVLRDIVFVAQVGVWPIVVHGGGPEINQRMEAEGLVPKFVQGRRVTDEPALHIVQRVLIDEISLSLCQEIEKCGGKAIPLNGRGSRFLEARKLVLPEAPEVDLGFVGEVSRVDVELVRRLCEGGVIPVVTSIARGSQGELLNVNADSVATFLAAAIGAEKLIFLVNTRGLLRHSEDPESLISSASIREVEALVKEGAVTGGMIPKVEACLFALREGVRKIHLISAYEKHSLLIEIFTDAGIGTEIRR